MYVISAQCLECHTGDFQTSAGTRREYLWFLKVANSFDIKFLTRMTGLTRFSLSLYTINRKHRQGIKLGIWSAGKNTLLNLTLVRRCTNDLGGVVPEESLWFLLLWGEQSKQSKPIMLLSMRSNAGIYSMWPDNVALANVLWTWIVNMLLWLRLREH